MCSLFVHDLFLVHDSNMSFSALVHICHWLFYDLFKTWLQFDHHLFISCSLLFYVLYTPCKLYVHNFATYKWLVHDLFVTCDLESRQNIENLWTNFKYCLYITCSWLLSNLLLTFWWLAHDSIVLFVTCLSLLCDSFITSYHDLFLNSSWLVHELFMTCSLLVYYLSIVLQSSFKSV